MNRIKAGIRAMADRLGYAIDKKRPIAFPALIDVPRYVEHDVELLGRRFRISDAASFLASYREIFEDEIYRFDSTSRGPQIIDCGANYGVSIRYFKQLYPHCRIRAVEADPRIYTLLQANVEAAQLGDVELIHRAVSASDAPLTFYSEGADGGRTHENAQAAGTVTVDGITLDQLIDGPVDFLKVDIEGAETDALRSCTKLHLVNQMFVEYHSFAGQTQTLDELLSIFEKSGFRYYIHTQLCSPRPLTLEQVHMGMDMQLNIFAKRIGMPAPAVKADA